MASRPDVERDRLTPASDGLAAVTATSENPAVLAFVLGQVGDHVVLEALNQSVAPTFVYRAAGPDGLPAINRALDDAGFQLDLAPGAGSAAVGDLVGLAAGAGSGRRGRPRRELASSGRRAASRLSSSGRPRRERDHGGVVQRADDSAPAL
jgi:hypothetical protein